MTEADVLDTVETLGNPRRLDWQIDRTGSPRESSTPETGRLDPAGKPLLSAHCMGEVKIPIDGEIRRKSSRTNSQKTMN